MDAATKCDILYLGIFNSIIIDFKIIIRTVSVTKLKEVHKRIIMEI